MANYELGLSQCLWAIVAGALGGMAAGLITEYYTASKPVERIAESENGTATVMITGLGMESVVHRFSACWVSLRLCRVVWCGHCSLRHVGNGWYDHGARRLWPRC